MSQLNRRSRVAAVTVLCLAASPLAGGAEPPPGARGQRPHYPWHDSYKAVIDQTAAVVEGVVTEVVESYDEQDGPRTLVTLADLRPWWGDHGGGQVVLRLFGGPVPGRRGRVDVVHVPTFVRGQRYLVFLSNRDWRLSPVTAGQSFIVERLFDQDVVVSADGWALSGIDDATGPRRAVPVYRLPDEVEDGHVPVPDRGLTAERLRGAHTVASFVAELKEWAVRQGVSVHGAFEERPYRSGQAVWRVLPTTPDPSAEPREPAPAAGVAPRPAAETATTGGVR